MNRNFTPTSKWLRSIFAVASVVATLVIASAIGALAKHYEAESHLARTQAVTVAQR